MLTMRIGVIVALVLLVFGVIQWAIQSRERGRQKYILDYAEKMSEIERQKQQEQRRREEEEDQKQKNRMFQLDFRVTHGAAFGGCAATAVDGRKRRGSVDIKMLDMYGKDPTGNDHTYHLEEDLEISAMDEPDTLLIRAKEVPFEIREEGLRRDEGVSTRSAVIKKDVLYYIVLESKHEISIKATKAC